MPLFQFQAVDATGNLREGQIEAEGPRQAAQELNAQGFVLQKLTRAESNEVLPPVLKQAQAPLPVALQPTHPEPFSQRASAPGSAPPVLSAARPEPRAWEDSTLTPKQFSMLWFQLHAFMKAGYGVAEALRLVSGRVYQKELSEACQQMAEGAARGERLSDMMERYPRLFPEYTIGNIRGGELGGYLPDAILDMGNYNEQWHKIKLWYWIPRTCLFNGLLTAPLWAGTGLVLLNGLTRYGRNPEIGVFAAVSQAAGAYFFKWVLPFWLLCVALYILWKWVIAPFTEQQRSRIALNMPIVFGFGGWVKSSAIKIFLNHLTRLYNAGISPSTVWETAIHSVPNRSIAEKLQTISLVVGDQPMNVDHAIAQSGLFPPEQVAMLSTAVQTGDVTGMLQKMTAHYEEESKWNAARTRMGLIRLAVLIALIAFAVGCLGFLQNYYWRIFEFVDDFMGQP